MENEETQDKSVSIVNPGGNLVYNILDIEADRFFDLRLEAKDLYFADPATGEFRKLAEAFSPEVDFMHKELMKKKKMRFFITFSETFDMEDNLRPVALKIARLFARQMGYGNIVKGFGFNDLQRSLDTSSRYLTSGINQLLENDVIRYRVVKNRRIYMVNPVFYFKGSTTGIYTAIGQYRKFPKYEKEEVY